MKLGEALQKAHNEVVRATQQHPRWPKDPIHAMAVLGEEYGELNKALLQHIYEPHKEVTREDIEEEAVQTAAMALRFLANLDNYEFKKAEQLQ